MAIFLWTLMTLVGTSHAQISSSSTEERALLLNQELEFLQKSAPEARVFARPGSAPGITRRSGPVEDEVLGVENVEDRYFRDEVNVREASSLRDVDVDPIDEADVERSEEDVDTAARRAHRVDGSVPKMDEL